MNSTVAKCIHHTEHPKRLWQIWNNLLERKDTFLQRPQIVWTCCCIFFDWFVFLWLWLLLLLLNDWLMNLHQNEWAEHWKCTNYKPGPKICFPTHWVEEDRRKVVIRSAHYLHQEKQQAKCIRQLACREPHAHDGLLHDGLAITQPNAESTPNTQRLWLGL